MLDLQPHLPNYPLQLQNIRIYGNPLPGLGGPIIYRGYVQQYTRNFTLRDREACYVLEPNRSLLFPGIVLARLIDNYDGLPLFDTCCMACTTQQPSLTSHFPITGTPGSGTSGTSLSAGCALWTYGDSCPGLGDRVVGVSPFYLGVPASYCNHAVKDKMYLVFTRGPSALTSLGVIPLCYDASSGGWDVDQALSPSVCGIANLHFHFFIPGGINSNICEIPLSANPWLVAVQCEPTLIMQGWVNTACGPTAQITIMEAYPTAPYCGGAAAGSSASGGSISMLGLGTASSGGIAVNTLTKSNVTVQTGRLVAAIHAVSGSPGLGVPPAASVTWGGTTLTYDAGTTYFGTNAAVAVYSASVSAGTNDLVFDGLGFVGADAQVINILNLPTNAVDGTPATASGAVSAPATGNVTTTQAAEALWAVFGMISSSGAWTWGGGFTSGGQDISEVIGLNFLNASEGRRITTVAGTYGASLSGTTPAGWGGILVPYK